MSLHRLWPAEASDTAYDEDSAKSGRSTTTVPTKSCKLKDSQRRMSHVIPKASTMSGCSNAVPVSRIASFDSSQRRMSHVIPSASTTSGRRTAVPEFCMTSVDSQERMTRVTSIESTTSGQSTVPVSRTTSFDSQSLAGEDLQELQPLYRLARVATPQSSELESAGWDTSPSSPQNELLQTETELMTSKLIQYYRHHLLSLAVTTPILKLQRMMNFRLQRALETWRAHCVQHKFSMCSTNVQRVINSTLTGALRTWKQRTVDPLALERRRMKLLQEKAIQHLLDRQLTKHLAAWQALKKQVKGTRLSLQDRRGNSWALLNPDPVLAWNKRLPRHQSSQLRQDIVSAKRSQQNLHTRCSAPTLGSEAGPDFIRSIFARIQKSRNPCQVLVCFCL